MRTFIDENGSPRVFCVDRFERSLILPDFSRQMLAENMLTWESADRNGMSNMLVIDGPLVDGDHHVAVYHLYPSAVPEIDVEMVIKSGYVKSVIFSHIKRRFNVLQMLRKCYYEQTKVPK